MNKKYVHYYLDRDLFRKRLKELGYKNFKDFCAKTGLHRNTLQYYWLGRPLLSEKFVTIAAALDLDPKELMKVQRPQPENIGELSAILTLLSGVPHAAVILLGSRARGGAKRYSDWDLGFTCGRDRLTGRQFLRLRGQVAELAESLPRKVDLVNLDCAPDWFLGTIDHSLQLLAGDVQSLHYFEGVVDGFRKCQTQKVA